MDKSYIESKRGTVMDTVKFRDFILEVYEGVGFSYINAAEMLGSTPPTVRRVVFDGVDSDVLRKSTGILKSDRVRFCFECTKEFRNMVNEECEATGTPRSKFMHDLVVAHIVKSIGQPS